MAIVRCVWRGVVLISRSIGPTAKYMAIAVTRLFRGIGALAKHISAAVVLLIKGLEGLAALLNAAMFLAFVAYGMLLIAPWYLAMIAIALLCTGIAHLRHRKRANVASSRAAST